MSPVTAPTRSPIGSAKKPIKQVGGRDCTSESRNRIQSLPAWAAPTLRAWEGERLAIGADDGRPARAGRGDDAAVVGDDQLVARLRRSPRSISSGSRRG